MRRNSSLEREEAADNRREVRSTIDLSFGRPAR
jgi:hypothetical protein